MAKKKNDRGVKRKIWRSDAHTLASRSAQHHRCELDARRYRASIAPHARTRRASRHRSIASSVSLLQNTLLSRTRHIAASAHLFCICAPRITRRQQTMAYHLFAACALAQHQQNRASHLGIACINVKQSRAMKRRLHAHARLCASRTSLASRTLCSRGMPLCAK